MMTEERLRFRVAMPLSPCNASDTSRTDLDAYADYNFRDGRYADQQDAREIPRNGVPGWT